ncbi:MAG: T9SS type A sorting domain-containing protein [Lacibacter sp.]
MKRILSILTIILLMTTVASAQSNRPGNGGSDNVVKSVHFYPNPASSFINFEFKDINLSNYSLRIFSFIGKKVLEVNNLSSRYVVNLNDFFRGVYIFQLTDRSGQVIESGKFQVVK